RQLMNASFNRWHLVNAYGAFGSMTQMRRELIIEGTLSTDPATDNRHAYEFKGKPGDAFRKAPQVAPYNLRLDWMMWFLALGSWRQAWFSAFLEKILDGDPQIRRLLRTDSFDGQTPELIRVRVFEYRYTTRQERQQDRKSVVEVNRAKRDCSSDVCSSDLYHLRLDWMMWFLALGSWRQAWFSAFLEKILDGDPQIRRLLRTDSFDGQTPELIRVRVFEYRYTTRQERQQTGQWWWREESGTLVSPSGLE